MGCGVFVYMSRFDSSSDSILKTAWVSMVTLYHPTTWILGDVLGREDILPFPLILSAGVFDRQCIWKGDRAEAITDVIFVKQLDMAKVAVQILHGSIGQDGNAIFEPLSIANHDLVLVEIDILDP